MQTKLTLRLEEDLIEKAKRRAKASGKSVSQLVADYFRQFDEPLAPTRLPPITAALKGALCGVEIDESDYHRHLEEKYR